MKCAQLLMKTPERYVEYSKCDEIYRRWQQILDGKDRRNPMMPTHRFNLLVFNRQKSPMQRKQKLKYK